jgi:AraC-like DNA-binding protein
MSFLAVFAGSRALEHRLSDLLDPHHSIALAHSWSGLGRVVRERPVTAAVVELDALPPYPAAERALSSFRGSFPHLGIVLLIRYKDDPVSLFRLGRADIKGMEVLEVENLPVGLRRAVGLASQTGAASQVVRWLSPRVPPRELQVARLALDALHLRWSAEELASRVGLTRPYLSELFNGVGLPSLGHFLLWTRLFHAGHWLEEPGRTGESVARQLEYSSGAAFRRALKAYAGVTPTQAREDGGLRLVFREFLKATQLPQPRGPGFSMRPIKQRRRAQPGSSSVRLA